MFMLDHLPTHLIHPHYWLEGSGKFTPEATSDVSCLATRLTSVSILLFDQYEFGVSAAGKADLYINDR